MDGAEVYMLLIRKSGMPILGESVALPFFQQVEVLDWNWKIVNQDEAERRTVEDRDTDRNAKSDTQIKLEFEILASDFHDTESTQALKDLIANAANSTPAQMRAAMKEVDDIQKKAGKKAAKKVAKAGEEATREAQNQLDDYLEKEKEGELGNLEFSFSKRVDFASTQMLNAMKVGEIMPRVVITIFHRSVSAPLMIVVTAKNLRLLKYELSVEVDDTMADMKEDWEAEFSEISFSYTNTRGVDQQKGRLTTDSMAGAKLALAASNTTSLFVMKSRD